MSYFEQDGVRDARRHAPATERNRAPILEVLRRVLPASGTVLEVASGSGQHAVFFAEALPHLIWQPSDPDPELRASIAAWRAQTALPNLRAPLALDATSDDWPMERADAILCINMIHIAPWTAALGLFRGAARLLSPGAPLLLYGPFKRDGRHTAPSNAAFDASLRQRDPAWGVRDLAEVEAAATGFILAETIEMPANNLTLLLRRA
jgi:SAM-dependent methyltransferase